MTNEKRLLVLVPLLYSIEKLGKQYKTLQSINFHEVASLASLANDS